MPYLVVPAYRLQCWTVSPSDCPVYCKVKHLQVTGLCDNGCLKYNFLLSANKPYQSVNIVICLLEVQFLFWGSKCKIRYHITPDWLSGKHACRGV